MKRALGKVLLAVEFCPPLSIAALRSSLGNEGLVDLLRMAQAELTLAYPLAPPAGESSWTRARSEILELAGDLAGQGIGAGLWPVLRSEEWEPLLGADYYFPCAPTARLFELSVEKLLRLVPPGLSHMLLDLEPPQFILLKPLRAFSLGWRTSFAAARGSLQRVKEQLSRSGLASIACFFPPLMLDLRLGPRELLQRLAAVPVFATEWDYYAPLYYSTFAERFLWLSRRAARSLAARAVKRGIERWEDRLVPMLGTLGPGLMGEPHHLESPAELGAEIEGARRSGAGRVGIYNLEGVLYRYRRGSLVGKRGGSEIEAFFRLLGEMDEKKGNEVTG